MEANPPRFLPSRDFYCKKLEYELGYLIYLNYLSISEDIAFYPRPLVLVKTPRTSGYLHPSRKQCIFNQMISYLYEVEDQLLNFLVQKKRIY